MFFIAWSWSVCRCRGRGSSSCSCSPNISRGTSASFPIHGYIGWSGQISYKISTCLTFKISVFIWCYSSVLLELQCYGFVPISLIGLFIFQKYDISLRNLPSTLLFYYAILLFFVPCYSVQSNLKCWLIDIKGRQ